MRFNLTWREDHETRSRSVEAPSSEEAVKKLAAELGHPPDVTYEAEPEDDLGYTWQREPDDSATPVSGEA